MTHLSWDKRDRLKILAARWEGPISAAVLYPVEPRNSTDHHGVLKDVIAYYCEGHLDNVVDIHLHIGREGDLYPGNRLRNIALQNSNQSLVFLIDVDMIPQPGAMAVISTLYPEILSTLYLTTQRAPHEMLLLIVPAFELNHVRSAQPDLEDARGVNEIAPHLAKMLSQFPSTKAEVVSLWERGTIDQFRVRTGTAGHAATNYARWMSSTLQPYIVPYEEGFEPYVIAHRSILPYDERFTGYAKNKESYFYELNAAGYRFLVLTEPFLIHLDHPRVVNRAQDLEESWHAFKQEVREKYRT